VAPAGVQLDDGRQRRPVGAEVRHRLARHAHRHVGRNTLLLPGDVIAASGELLGPFRAGDEVTVGFEPIGILRNTVA
jgi:hypothetical protein